MSRLFCETWEAPPTVLDVHLSRTIRLAIPSLYTFPVPLAKQLLLTDVRRSAWASQNLLEGCAALSGEELQRDFRISHASILSTLGHTYDGERVWLDCLSTTADLGTWRLPPGPAPEYSLNTLRQKWPELWKGFDNWLSNLPEPSLAIELNLQLPGEIERRLAANVTIGRLVGMAEVADVAAFLASPRSIPINGDAIVCAGGARGAIHY